MSETRGSLGRRAFLVPVCLIACAMPSHTRQPGDLKSPPAPIPQAEKHKLTALLPGPPQFDGKPVRPPAFYSTDLYRYIDGAADAYLDYGLVALVHREFRYRKVDLITDIFDMGDPLRAFGVYSSERAPDYVFLPIGAEGYADAGILNFLHGTYYVKLQAFGDRTVTPDVLRAAANAIVARIGPTGSILDPVDWLPSTGLVERSQRYIVKAPMGREYLAPATTALYRIDGRETTVLVSLAPTPAEAASRLDKLKEDLTRSAQANGDVVFFSRGRYVVVIETPPQPPEGFLKRLYSSIKD